MPFNSLGGPYLETGIPKDLPQIEKDILKVILDMKKTRKMFSKKLIFKKCMAKLPYTENEIFLHLLLLYRKKFLVEGKQLVKTSILDSKNRKLLYDIINENPGIHLRELARFSNIPLKTCSWHLVILKKFEFIKFYQFKNQYCFGNVIISDELLKIHHILRNELNKKILSELIQSSDATIPGLSDKLSIQRHTIQNHVKELELFGLIERIQEGQTEFLKICNENLMKELLNPENIVS